MRATVMYAAGLVPVCEQGVDVVRDPGGPRESRFYLFL